MSPFPAQVGPLRSADDHLNVAVLRLPKRRFRKMSETSTMYEWIKALHVIAVIAWMAGMLYLPRLFVYHCEAEAGSKQSETFKVMERRLLKAIINPAMVVTWLAGLYLAWAGHWFSAGWLHGKLLLVVLLSGVHGFFSRCVKDFAADRNTRSQRFYRIINEVPTLLMIGIVILVVVKPF
jgi:protoporphyrinogen IX oxidase